MIVAACHTQEEYTAAMVDGREDNAEEWRMIRLATATLLAMAGAVLTWNNILVALGFAGGLAAACYWMSLLGWIAITAVSLRLDRRWWLLVTAPFAVSGAFFTVGLIAQCATGGDCL